MRLVALEWNDREARVAVAATARDHCRIEEAFSIVLAPRQETGQGADVNVGQQIADALAQRGVRRAETLVAIGRASIELRKLSLPPAPDDELPDLVRMLAVREFNDLDDNWRLDFLPADGPADQPRSVLAAAIGPELVAQIEKTCETAGQKVQHLVLRPCAAASLLCRAQPHRATEVRLLVDLLADEADLTVILGGQVAYLRTIRLPGDPLASTEVSTLLVADIRRTMAAAQNQLGGRAVESIVMCGVGDDQLRLAATIQQALSTPTELFDPFSAVELAASLRHERPDRPGRFAPLLGMLLDEAARARHGIDFLNPRRKPEPRSRRREYTLAGVVAGVLLAVYVLFNWLEGVRLENEIQLLSGQSRALEAPLAGAEKALQTAGEISKWTATDVTWLEELAHLCQDLPPAQEVVLTQMVCTASQSHGADVKVEGLASTVGAVDKLEDKLRDGAHHVKGEGRNQEATQKAYPWHFVSSISIDEEK